MLFLIGLALIIVGCLEHSFGLVLSGLAIIWLHRKIRIHQRLIKNTATGPPRCPHCGSRAYTVSPAVNKFFFSPLGDFLKLKIYRHTCRDCSGIWIVYYKDDYTIT